LAVVDELRAALPFRNLDDDHLARLAALGHVRTVESNHAVCRPGEESNGI